MYLHAGFAFDHEAGMASAQDHGHPDARLRPTGAAMHNV